MKYEVRSMQAEQVRGLFSASSKGEQTQLKWVYPSTPSLVRRGNQAQQQNFRSSSKSPDPSFRDVQPLHSFHSNGTLRRGFCTRQIRLCPLLPLFSIVTKRTAKGWNDSVTHASRTSLSFCAVGW